MRLRGWGWGHGEMVVLVFLELGVWCSGGC